MKNTAQVLHKAYLEAPQQATIHLLQARQPDRELSYRDLYLGAASYARALARAGIQPGEVVILILEHGADLPYAFFGAILRGAIPSIMPFLTEKLSPGHYRSALGSLFEITLPAAVVTYPAFLEEVQDACQGSSVRATLVTSEIVPVDPGDLEADEDIFAGLRCSPEEIVLLQHSSGTTGLQKGVALSHQAVFNQLESYAAALNLDAHDVIVSWLPLYHDMGLIAGFILPILQRVPVVWMSPFDWVRAPFKLMQAIAHYKGTLCWLPNFAYNFCAQKIRDRDLQDVDLSTWRAVINCSEPMVWKSHQAFLERFQPYGLRSEALATCYAMAENVFAVTQGGIGTPLAIDEIDREAFLTQQLAVPSSNPERSIKMVSAGRPIPNTRVRVLDAQGNDAPERQIGEIALQSNYMLTGYYHRPDLTEKAFVDGWYLTGDLGYLAGGELYVSGRKKDLIIVGGKNIYPQDLERLAGEVEGVHPGRVVAFGVFSEESGTEEVVIVAEIDFAEIDFAEIDYENIESQPDLRQRVAEEVRQKVTRGSDIAVRFVHVVGRNWLLKTSSGKIARAANREKYLAEVRP